MYSKIYPPHSKYQKGGPMMTSLAAFLKEMHSDVEETITPLNFFNEVSYFMFLSISNIHLYLLKPLKMFGHKSNVLNNLKF